MSFKKIKQTSGKKHPQINLLSIDVNTVSMTSFLLYLELDTSENSERIQCRDISDYISTLLNSFSWGCLISKELIHLMPVYRCKLRWNVLIHICFEITFFMKKLLAVGANIRLVMGIDISVALLSTTWKNLVKS